MSNETDPFSDRIHIEQLEISAHIGVPEKERAASHRLTVNTTLSPSRDVRDLNDETDRAVNYSPACTERKTDWEGGVNPASARFISCSQFSAGNAALNLFPLCNAAPKERTATRR